MANFSTLIAEIEAYIKTNGEQEITGQILQNVLKDIVDTLGNGAVFKGIATTDGTPGTPDNNVFYFAALAGTYTNYGGAVLDGNTLHILGYNGSWTDVDTGVPSATAAATFAKIDGYYASLTAGAAENLVGRGSVPASFLRRTTGGTADVGTGSAKIAKLMGNSIVWNQLCPNGNFASSSGWNTTNGSLTVSGNKATFTASAKDGYMSFVGSRISGHKYLVQVAIKTTTPTTDVYIASQGGPVSGTQSVATTKKQILSSIYTAPSSSSWDLGIIDRRESDWDAIEIENFQQIDLTKMFGAGKEPTTAAEFEALFPLEYYAYEPGKVLPFAAQKLVTTGFNQWDGQFVANKAINASTGNEANDTGSAHTDYIPIFPNTMYWFRNCGINSGSLGIGYYDANKNFVGGSVISEASAASFRRLTPAGAYYMRVSFPLTQKDNVCINLQWSGYRDGEYEPYELHELVMDPANWEDADGNKIFPYGGMHGVGTARDFAIPDNDGFIRKGTRVIHKYVITGNETWIAWGDNAYYCSPIPNSAVAVNGNATINLIAATKLPITTSGSLYSGAYTTGVAVSEKNIYISASDYANRANLVGMEIYYILDIPVETELATPVAASYYANDFGTEEWQPANTDEPYTAPCEMLIAYAMNAVDTLRRLPENYISAASFENFCTELATKLGAALNKSITIAATYDAEDEEYDYAITIEDIEEG